MILPAIPAWAMMWTLAGGLYALGKLLSLTTAHVDGAPLPRKIAYLLLWPGMNASSFLAPLKRAMRPRSLRGIARLAPLPLGAALLWWVARQVPYPLLSGWIGMVGIVLVLHFGILEAFSLLWSTAGFNAPPLMDNPLRSASVAEFWNVRWNTAFHELARRFIFKPMLRRTSPASALILTFLVSGLLHEIVITVPAHGGYGLPTLYFLLQAGALLWERTKPGRRLLKTALARVYVVAIVALPAFILFPPPFVYHVILPFMKAIGALPKEAFP